MFVFIEELWLCAEGDRAIHNWGACSQSGGGFLCMSTSHEDQNRNLLGLYFRFHCIIIIGCDRICGSYTRVELWAEHSSLGLTLSSLSSCIIFFLIINYLLKPVSSVIFPPCRIEDVCRCFRSWRQRCPANPAVLLASSHGGDQELDCEGFPCARVASCSNQENYEAG